MSVSRNVTSDFLLPVAPICMRYATLPGVSVPETPVQKHGNPCLLENEIRLPEQRVIPAPPSDFVFTQYR